MAIRSLSLILVMAMLLVSPLQACFGPKLFVGMEQGAQAEVLYALVTLYVKEKTGVESTPVKLTAGDEPLTLLGRNKADLVLVPTASSVAGETFALADVALLVSGPRPHDDLQFTTVLPAVRKLSRLLQAEHVAALVRRVEAGESAMAAARSFFMENRWI